MQHGRLAVYSWPPGGTGMRATARRFAAGLAIGLTLVVGMVAPALAADDEILYGGNDWYASIAGVVAVDNSDVGSADPSGGVTVSTGFRFNRWLTAEIEAEWIDQVRYDRGTGVESCRGTGGRSNGYTAWHVAGGGRLYFTKSLIQPFLSGHAGFMQTRDHGGGRSCEGNGFVARMGGGVDVFVTNGLAISVLGAYVLPTTGSADGHDYISLGLGLTWY